jgi:hypothetical protein
MMRGRPRFPASQTIRGLSELRSVSVQYVSLEEFAQLEENNILFIDSSHVLKIGSDVQYLYWGLRANMVNCQRVPMQLVLTCSASTKRCVRLRCTPWTKALTTADNP